jgi:2,5-dihydroxypyridine 5,6-dioxygenase
MDIKLYEFELGKAAKLLAEYMLNIKDGETVIITADTESDFRVVNATAREVFTLGAKPMIVAFPAPNGVGKAADPEIPLEALTGALQNSDVWIEFNNKWLLYSTAFENAYKLNKRLKYICLVGMNADIMIRTIGKVNIPKLEEFLIMISDITHKAKTIKMKTLAGTDVSFENHPLRPMNIHSGKIPVGSYEMLPGQISWTPNLETINGTIVFDGSINPPIGLLKEPVVLRIEKGMISKIEQGRESNAFANWLESFNDPQMYQMAHISYGFNPGAKLTGNVLEDERVWGATEWGIGYVGTKLAPDLGGIPAASHTDGICLETSIWLDEVQILDKGKVVAPPELIKLAKEVTKSE